MWQLEGSVGIGPEDLSLARSRSFASYITERCAGFARLTECRRLVASGLEIVSFDLDVGLPQRPAYAIASTEPLSACFWPSDGGHPAILATRTDFPDTPHQIMVPHGTPACLCVDDRPWQDVRDAFTSSELVARIVAWFEKACEGALHGSDQPFEPVFLPENSHEIIMTARAERAIAAGERLELWSTDERRRHLVLVPETREGRAARLLNIHVVTVAVTPAPMARLRKAPRTLAELAAALADRGTDLVKALEETVRGWMENGRYDEAEQWRTAIVVSMPQIHPGTGEIGPSLPMAFVSAAGPGEIGEALGVLARNSGSEAGEVRFVKLLGGTATVGGLEAIQVQLSPVHHELDAERAAAIAGHDGDHRRAVLVGAGALGSHLVETLVREGLFDWTVVDGDDFLPHNVARHTLTSRDAGTRKAVSLADRIERIRPDAAALAICADVLSDELPPNLIEALSKADVIIDASASVPVARRLCDRSEGARRLSAFFSPNGRSAVLMAETSDRSTDLRDLEGCYLRELLVNESLAGHLNGGQSFRYSGACRALSGRIPASSVAALSGLLSGAIAETAGVGAAALRVWSMTDHGGVECVSPQPAVERMTLGRWTVRIPHALLADLRDRRANALPNETGGPLVGTIDLKAGEIMIAHALETPPDSEGKPGGFKRGTKGLRRRIESARDVTGGQVVYVGEWHSHPQNASTLPSATDLQQMGQLAGIMEIDELPAVSLILGDNGHTVMVGKTALP